MRGITVTALLASIASAAAATPAAAQLSPTPSPLAGGAFQGADGDQDDDGDAGLIDWQRLQRDGRVTHKSDEPNVRDSAFGGGSAELEPDLWSLTTANNGVAPPENNVRDAWSSLEEVASPTQPGRTDVLLYAAFTRGDQEGNAVVSFELNRDDRLWRNSRGALIPCRLTGDVQVSFQPQGAAKVAIVVDRWTTTTSDPASGCATRGTLDRFASIGADDAQAAMNTETVTGAAEIANYLPGALPSPLEAGVFGETAVNLTSVLRKAFDDDCLAYTSMWIHSRPSFSETAALKDYVAPQPLELRTCAASGTKFFDSNANGVRDRGEPGIPRFVVWADYDNDGVQDDDEPFSVSDDDGRYVIDGIRPTRADRAYWLRERLLQSGQPTATDWICSHPATTAPGGRFPCAHGPIDAGSTPFAQDRDFGNWLPAELTVEKALFPAGDLGVFDLLVGDEIWASGGDGTTETRPVPPGIVRVGEAAVDGTDPGSFLTSVSCRRTPASFGRSLAGGVFESLELEAGDVASCTFYNVRRGSSAIAIRKRGPGLAVAGERLRYRLLVTNPGAVPFPADAVAVTDPRCDRPPRLVSKRGDETPGTLDPGDAWVYRCSHATTAGADCAPTAIANTSAVSGTAAGTTVTDEDTIETTLACPDKPLPPPPVPVPVPVPVPGGDPDVPGPVAPAGPSPPRAGAAGRVRVLLREATRRCLRTRVPRIDLAGTRIASVRVFVAGRLRRRLNVRTLQGRVRPRVTLPPGSHRVRVRVAFERGAGTPPLTLTGVVRICAPRRAAAPRYTG